jgi:Peptidase A4 family
MRLLRYSLIPATAAVVAGAMMFAGPGVTGAAGPVRAAGAYHRPSARFLAEARTALVKYLRHGHQTAELVHPGGINSVRGATADASYNWSGYADASATDQAFSKVTGQWTTPAVTCTAEDTLTSEWVGIDGFNSSTVEQDGTFGWCFEGKPTYFTWYEMYPAGTVEVGSSLAPGDKITATVSRSGTSYTLSLTDATHTANSFSKKATCALATCLDTSAEWIAERPAFSIGIATLADYASWRLSGAAETASGKAGTISSFTPNYVITMVDATGSYDLSTTSGLTGGNSFTTTWHNSY